MRNVFVIMLAASWTLAAVGCEKQQPPPAPKVEPETVEPTLNIDKETHYKVYVDDSYWAAGSGSMTMSDWFELTVKPVNGEVHYLWSDPEIESMPVGTQEEKISYFAALVRSRTPTSFVVSSEGSFLRLADEDLLRAGYRADSLAAETEYEQRVSEKFADVEAMLEARKAEAEEFWDEMGGAYLQEFTLGKAEIGKNGSKTIESREECSFGECWVAEASESSGDLEPEEFRDKVKKLKGTVTKKETEAQGLFDTKTMLPVEVQSEMSLEVATDESGQLETKFLVYTEKYSFEVSSKPPRRSGLSEVPSFEPKTQPDDAEAP